MTKVGGSLLKLDAICAKLKTNLQTKQATDTELCSEQLSDDSQIASGITILQKDHTEPNNNSTALVNIPKTVGDFNSQHNGLSRPESPADPRSPAQRSEVTEALPAPSPEPVVDATSEMELLPGRKNRRKAQRPQSITHMMSAGPSAAKDELVEYELNNPDLDFDSVCEAAMEEDEPTDPVSEPRSHPSDSGDDRMDDSYGVLDLSVNHRPRRDIQSVISDDDLSADEDDTSIMEENGVLNLSISPRKSMRPVKKNGAEEVEMKDYAENTMNELLSMYGLSDEAKSIASKVPLNHFRTGTILDRSPRWVDRHSRALAPRGLASPRDTVARMTTEPMGCTPRRLGSVHQDSTALSPESLEVGVEAGISAGLRRHFDDQMFSVGADHLEPNGGNLHVPDYYKYLKKFRSHEECGGNHCQDVGYKEHYHCLDCSFRVFVKKEEMIRHFKWHKKREESLQHGFMRYSSVDDCSRRFSGSCPHNNKQTHYHCLQCNKVYISTSDVQMHANYHRKDSAIQQEGFQRFRATEDCGTTSCAFYNQRTTHFHCRRPTCSFTFKNKADMEKHKTYHQKDEILAKDGFKKFMKYEHCNFPGCRYSKVSNHIHCIRPGCDYVLHSTGQLYSHKRKHERRDFEHAYKRFKEEQTSHGVPPSKLAMLGAQGFPTGLIGSPPLAGFTNPEQEEFIKMTMQMQMSSHLDNSDDDSSQESSMVLDQSLPSTPGTSKSGLSSSNGSLQMVKKEPEDFSTKESKPLPSTMAKLISKLQGSEDPLSSSLSLPIPVAAGLTEPVLASSLTTIPQPPLVRVTSPQTAVGPTTFIPKVSPPVNEKKERDENWKKYLTRYTANDPCHSRCQFLYKDHYHCNTVNCGMLFRSKDGVREHAKFHQHQDRITSLTFMVYEKGTACPEACQHSGTNHYHCLWAECNHVIAATDPVFSRMEHYKIHEYSRAAAGRRLPVPRPSLESFKRRRGRPPKYPKNDIPMVPKFWLPDAEITEQARTALPDNCIFSGFKMFSLQAPCPDDKCMFFVKEHYHCLRQRCHYTTDRADVLNLHAKDFHSYITIMDGFEFFDRTINCRRPHCHNNRANRHFHCVRPRCDYSFVRVSTMAQHDKKHMLAEMGLTQASAVAIPKMLLPSKGAPIMPAPPIPQSVNLMPMPRGIVKASGTFFPVPNINNPGILTTGMVQVTNNPSVMVAVSPKNPVSSSSQVPARVIATPLIFQPVSTSSSTAQSTPTSQLVTIAPKPPQPTVLTTTAPITGSTALPLTMLLQQKASNIIPQPSWVTLLLKMHYGAQQNCGRPFCKLKKKEHYHCFDCNQAFSDPSRLKGHVFKHGFNVDNLDQIQGRVLPLTGSKAVPSASTPEVNQSPAVSESDSEPEPDVGGSLNLNPGAFSNLLHTGMTEQHSMPRTPTELVMDLSMPEKMSRSSYISNMKRKFSEAHQDHVQKVSHADNDTHQNQTTAPSSEESDDSQDRMVIAEEAGSPGEDHSVDFLPQEDQSSTDPVEAQPDLLQCLGLRKASDSQEEDSPARRSRRKRVATKHDGFVNSDAALAKVRKLSTTRQSQTPTYPAASTTSPRPGNPQKVTPARSSQPQVPHVTISTPKFLTTSVTGEALSDPVGEPPLIISQFVDKQPVVGPGSSSGSPHTAKEELSNAPEYYHKYRFNEDCKFERCAYRQSQSHYHCLRPNCGYAFCDRSRYQQHNDRHKRISDLMGDEFVQYRANVDCGRTECEYKQRSSHFHCLKCAFICTDSGKVGAHRKHHTKMDNVSAQGFQKFSQGEACPVANCTHTSKHSHYHCTLPNCHQVALGPAQMSAHKVTHDKV